MGQSCGCADSSQEDKIKELEKLLAKQKDEISKLQLNYTNITDDAKKLQENNTNDSTKLKKQINRLESEKKNTIKEMMKEKKKISKLQETKEKLENKKRNMEKKIAEYKKQINKIESSSSQTKSHGGNYGYEKEESVSVSVTVTEMKSPSMSPAPSPRNYNIQDDMNEIYEWLVTKSGDKKQDHKFFNKKMTDLLTKRDKKHTLNIASLWYDKYGKTLLDQIEYKLSGKTRSVPYRILSGLLQSSSEIDSRWIQECMYNDMQIDKIANVIGCRGINDIYEIKKFWKSEYGSAIQIMLDKCAEQYKKKTLLHLFRNLCNTEQREKNNKMQTKEKVNLIEIDKHIEWMINTGKYKHADKEKMCKLVSINSDDYVQILVKKYKNKSKNGENIFQYLDRKYGVKSMVGQHLKNHIQFIQNKNLYFANNIKLLGESKEKFKENNSEILNIFLSRFHVDLNQIRIQFANANNGKRLKDFIKEKGANHSSVYFLMKILEASKRYS